MLSLHVQLHHQQWIQHLGERMLSLHVHETILFCRIMVKIPFPNISFPKSQSVDLFCFSILMHFSVQSLVI